MDPIVWSILLLIAAIALFVLELFVPSGGVIGVMAALSAIGSIGVAFTAGVREGVIMMCVTTIIVPILFASAVRLWPKTPIGQMILCPPPEDPDDVLPETDEYHRDDLLGRIGRARTTMLPSGSVTIDERNYDAISAGMPIEPGQVVKVVDIRTNRIVVRPTGEELPTATAASPDVLDRPVDALGLDDLNEPLT